MVVLQININEKKIIKLLNQNLKTNNMPHCLFSIYAKILDGIVDIILIGNFLGTTLCGMKNSRGVTLNMMKAHGLAVTKMLRKVLL